MTPPIRFLALVVGGWAVARAFSLLPDTGTAQDRTVGRSASVAGHVAQANAPAPAVIGEGAAQEEDSGNTTGRGAVRLADRSFVHPAPTTGANRRAAVPTMAVGVAGIIAGETSLHAYARLVDAASPSRRIAAASMPRAESPSKPGSVSMTSLPAPLTVRWPGIIPVSRLSADAWMLARTGDGAGALAAGSFLLGGSQAGARLLYRVAGDASAPVSVSARVSSPLRRNGTEAAVGIEWQPVAGLPVRVLAERRQRVAGTGRSAFALLAHGGVSDLPVASGFRLDAYGQAGVVGARRRDLFADGGATLVRPLGSAPDGPAVGIGAWGGAQPGAARLDIGPRVTAAVGAAGVRARVSLDWRFRVAGGAAPDSGPTLTIATGF